MLRKKTGRGLSSKKILDFFACLVVVVDPTGLPHFFVRAVMSLTGWPRFDNALIGLAIGGAILTEREVACWLLWIVFVVGGNKLLKVLNCQCRLPSIHLLRIAFLQDQIVKPWQLTCCWLFGIDRIVSNVINLVLLIIISFELEIQLCIIYLPLLCNVLFQ